MIVDTFLYRLFPPRRSSQFRLYLNFNMSHVSQETLGWKVENEEAGKLVGPSDTHHNTREIQDNAGT